MKPEALDASLDVARLEAAVSGRPLRLRAGLAWQATQVVADFITIFAAANGAYWLYLMSGIGVSHYDPAYYARLDLVLAGIATFALHGYGSYRGHLGLLRIESVRRILRAVGSAVLMVLAASFFLQIPAFSRFHMLVAGPVVTVALLGQKFALWHLQEALRSKRNVTSPVVVYGAGETGRLLAQHLLEEHALGLRPVAFLDDREDLRFTEVKAGPGVNGLRLPVLGGEDALDATMERTGARAVFLAMPSAPSDRIAQIVAKLEERNVAFYGVPSSGNLVFSSLSFGQIGSIPVFTRRVAAANPFQEATKRVIDIAGATFLLLVTSPLIVGGALAIRLGSPGPVFFRQRRVGLGGKPFTIFKLRTMRQDAPAYAEHPRTSEDPRVTRVGRFLRRSCIDELPQLINVLRGEMSLVGPRPEMPQIVREYRDMERQRLSVKPGVTGLWQISADRAFRIHDNMQYDLYYVDNRGLSLDLAIMLMTPFVMMARDRAL